jgi:hypothetical protein
MSAVESICADLGIRIIPCNEALGPMLTKAGQTLRRILEQYGEGHCIIVLRTITESAGNDCALIAPVIWGVSDLVLAHPSWSSRGLAWIEAFDGIDLITLAKTASANRKAVPKREAMAAMLYERLAPIFDPPKPVRVKAEPKPPISVTRIPGIEKNIRLGLDLLALRSTHRSNCAFGRVRRQFEVDGQHACETMRVARLYGAKPEIYTRLSWNALVMLSSPSLPAAVRQDLETRVISGERVGEPEIRAARGALMAGKRGSHHAKRSTQDCVNLT